MKRALLLLLVLALAACKSASKEKDDTQSPAPTDSARVTIPTDGVLPVLTRWRPPGDEADRTIILLHGGGGPELVFGKWIRPYTDALVAARYDVYMPHYFQRKQSSEIDTARATINFIQRSKNGAHRIGIVGFSRGGFIAVETGAKDDRVKAVVELYGGIHKDAASQLGRMPPTLILHGDKDPIVTVDHANDLKKLFEEKKVDYEIKIYPGEEHGFGGEALTDSVKRMIAFFDKHL